ncbi:MAG: hypothetical protein GXP35_08150 [Actinobacteria bacterium]|nr:hypothetical protein [Actinomycetota bacterium]
MTTKRQDAELVASMNAERDSEYAALVDDIAAVGPTADGRTIGRFRREWRRIERRDHFRSPRRDEARLAVQSLTVAANATTVNIADVPENAESNAP